MFKVNFSEKEFPAVSMFKIFKTKEQAELFINEIGDKFVSIKEI
jgi:hypothetical protein